MQQTFRKDERLCRKKLIAGLFEKGTSLYIFPFRVTWLKHELPPPFPVQLLITVPKSNFRKAVQRNLLKRRIREAYRRNKQPFYDDLTEKKTSLLLCIQYSSKEILSSQSIQEKIILLLRRLMEANEKTAG